MTELECRWTPDEPEACMYCTGEACGICDVAARRPSIENPCEHDVAQRHLRP